MTEKMTAADLGCTQRECQGGKWSGEMPMDCGWPDCRDVCEPRYTPEIAALLATPTSGDVRGLLRRMHDHLSAWANDHPDEATTETAAILYCAKAVLNQEAGGQGPPPIPLGVYYLADGDNFYSVETKRGMGWEFWYRWRARKGEFPTSAIECHPALQEAEAIAPQTEVERAKNAIRDEVGSQLCAWIGDDKTARACWRDVGKVSCLCEDAARAALSRRSEG